MHFLTDAVTAIFSDHAIAMFLHPALNSVANIAQRRARLHHLNTFPHRFIGSLYQPAGQRGDIAYQVHLTGVGNHARFLEGDIDVNNHPGAQMFGRFGDPVAHHIVNGSVQHIGKIVLPLAGRAGVQLVDDKIFHSIVNRHRRYAGNDKSIQHIKHRRQQLAGMALPGEFVGGFNDY